MNTKTEEKPTNVEKLFEKADNYIKTSIELLKLSSIDKASEVLSVLASHLIISILVAFFLFFINVGISLWLGKIIGEYYAGFLIVSVFYLLLGIVIYKFRKQAIEKPIYNLILNTVLRSKIEKDEKDE